MASAALNVAICRAFAALLALALTLVATVGQAVTLLRDPDIERGLTELARPILLAAGLSPSTTRIILIRDSSLNAFVLDSRAIYIHSGLVLRLDTAAQLQSVIAHEAAHIANNHFSRRLANLRNANRLTGLGIALAVAATAGGAPGGAAAGLAAGAAGSAQRNFFAHTREEEAAADQSGIRYLLAAGVPTKGAIELLDLFRGQETLSPNRRDPYASTHPLTADRYRALAAFVTANPGPATNNAVNAAWFARVKAKLSAFTRAPSWTLRRAEGDSDLDIMARAIAYHRTPDVAKAIDEIAKLVTRRPGDPYYRELQGQILLESRRIGPAVQAYRTAVEVAPGNALILAGYGRALLAQNTPNSNREALRVLQDARARDARSGATLRDLGQAFARAGQVGMASLTAAERAALRGRLDDAALHAGRAATALPRGSTGWQRAQDILRDTDRN
ncbi:MAG: M48 family metalloprotease [Pseudomonadota bacterium]